MSPRRGIPFVVSAPSGTGKTTLCRAVVARDAGIEFSISHTTRPPRPGEVSGVHYYFVSPAEFEARVRAGGFLEHAEYAGNRYGTSLEAIEGPLARGRDLLLEVEVQGARQIRARRPDARLVFLLPPTLAELEARLRRRGTDDEHEVARRLEIALPELAAVHEFDYAVVNDRLETAIEAVLAIVRAERAGDPSRARARFGREATLSRVGRALGLDGGRRAGAGPGGS